ncbi:AfsR/SARP family transcriptional regulator [Streptacidiphilus fuscans]|uniref:Winged helix-turn-helix domain-containing protein n=1 Tax=Streptacidiphilus fuscans TaxID=2789292 RepID=A0A931B9E4_9ACTN|nr:BTAD domain-containing putative transcriptional regulator [Streptacidiphilus fuscans]MBF9072598.1 winged helix-turn-helix domain-containing protein [Streptacidiphilus fuscans]
MGGPKRRTVLAALAIQVNRPVSVERLLDVVWDGEPPAQARAALQGHIAALRKALPPGFALETLPAGYRLSCDPRQVDTAAFDERVRLAQGAKDPGERSDLLQQALGLWRGSALADLPASEFQRTTAAWLRDRRLAALTTWTECELARGEGAGVIPWLQGAVRVDGLRENLVAGLMRCLAQAGRQAEALEEYQRTAALLRDELGTRPGPELQAALAEVLSGEQAPEPPARGVLPASEEQVAQEQNGLPRPVRLIGRQEDLDWLDSVVRPHTHAAPAAVVGPAGIGKTSLVLHWAHRAAERFPDGVLFADLRGFADEEPQDPQDVLAAFLLSLGVPQGSIPAAPEARADLYARLTRDRCLLVVLDNAPSAEAVRSLLPAGDAGAAVVTSRAALLDLVARDGAVWRALDPLSADESVALLATAVGRARVDAEPEQARRLAVLLDRLPLALRICGSRLAVRPAWTLAQLVAEFEDEGAGLDGLDTVDANGIRAALTLSCRHLAPASVRLLALLALYPGPRITPGVAAALLGTGLPTARLALDDLAAHHLVTEERLGVHSRTGLVRRFARHLLEETVPQEERRDAFDRLLDHALAVSASATLPSQLFPWLVEWPSGDRPVGVRHWTSGGEAQAWLDEEEPTLRFLLREAARTGRHDHAWRLAENLYTYYVRVAAHGDTWVELAGVALSSAEASGSPLAVRRMRSHLSTALAGTGRAEEGLSYVRSALALAGAAGDLESLCVAQVRLGVCLELLERPAMEVRAAWEAALSIARALDEPRAAAAIRSRAARAAALCGDPEQALRYVEEPEDFPETGSTDPADAAYAAVTEETRIALALERARALHDLGRSAEALVAARDVLARIEQMREHVLVRRETWLSDARRLVEAAEAAEAAAAAETEAAGG